MEKKFKKALFEVVMLGEDIICTSTPKEKPTEGDDETEIDVKNTNQI